MVKVPLTDGQLRALRQEQLQLIEQSCEAFDRGLNAEAKRLALAIRILLHDTRHSKSLLGQLQELDREFYDTLVPLQGDSIIPEMGLIVHHGGTKGFEYVAPLDTAAAQAWTQFDQWWNGVICQMPTGESASRRSLVLTATNQDGGAHVDPSLDALYHRLVYENGLGYILESDGNEPKPMGDPTKAALRQIAHEVLKTLVDGYGKSFVPSGPMFSGMWMSTGPSKAIAAIHYQGPDGTKTPPDMACPCGSGAPYKGCHDKT